MNNVRIRRGTAAAAAAMVVAGLVTAAGPAAAAAPCTPKIQVLGALTPDTHYPDSVQTQGVLDFGAGNLSVGVSGGKPVYWTGTTLHKVPLADPNAGGRVLAVNRHGLMVGVLHDAAGTSLFSYRKGAAAITTLPGGHGYDMEADVNDAGYIVSRGTPGGVVWKDGVKVRDLPVPADAGPGTRIEMVTGINGRGDVLGMSEQDYEVPETGEHLRGSHPVLWPGDGSPARTLAPSGGGTPESSHVQDIDESGRIVGYDWRGPWHEYKPFVWTPPHTGPGSSPGVLSTHPYGTFEAISATTNVSVGTARFHPESMTLQDQAQWWPGSGPVLALPRLAKDAPSTADAVTDDDRVGGAAVNAKGRLKPVIWTCASKQAYAPAR
ncbi:hypothetical protein OHA84_30760 [Streptomyces sp. NBC_00513]|uniref:hypothetical protein n=1 Tax=unclassified Streptomyces TaxID=2593676 RepID=UPI002253C3F0|nr:hypothetical protein [Streptomyces sp. NBC_00424]MCX5072102.1 hypothetical protein [Streptomyces sp. NBC_00424]WUD44536.1 hypothetical protein OHA84_30760 [Streptomyces sp. NBC_00513]